MGLNDNIPNKVTIKNLLEAADAYERVHGQDDSNKDNTGIYLYRLVRGIIKNGLYSYKEAFYEEMFSDGALPNPNDYD